MSNAQSTLSTVGAEVDAAANDAKSLAGRVKDTVSENVTAAKDFVADGVSRAVDGARDLAAQAPEVGEWAGDKLGTLRDQVRDKPILTLAIAAGVGAVISALLRR